LQVSGLAGFVPGAVAMTVVHSFNSNDERRCAQEFVYVDTATGGVDRRNHVMRIDQYQPHAARPDCFTTWLRFTEDLKTYAAGNLNERGNPSVKGYPGPAWADVLVFDFDSEQNPAEAQREAGEAILRWEGQFDLPRDAVRIFFSGFKGIGLEIPATLFGGFSPSEDLHDRLRRLADVMAHGFQTVDRSMYQKLRLWRVVNHINSKSGLHKVALTVDELLNADLDNIREIARAPRRFDYLPDGEWRPRPELVALWAGTAIVTAPESRAPTVTSDNGHTPKDYILDRALSIAATEGRDNAWLWAGCQLRDNKIPQDQAEALASDYVNRCPPKDHPYTLAEALKTTRSAYSRPPRAPWKSTAAELEALLTPASAAGASAPAMPAPADCAVQPVRVNEQLAKADRDFVLRCHFEQEYGDAKLFALLYRDRIVFDHGARTWHLWGGHAWQPDRSGQIKRLVGGQLAAQYLAAAADLAREAEAIKASEPEKAADLKGKEATLIARAMKVRNANRLGNILSLASSFLGISGDEWDADPWLLGARNGVINLRMGQLRPGQPGDYIRTQTPTEWQGLDAPAPRWEQFIREVFNEEGGVTQAVGPFLQRLLGYGVSGKVTEHVLPVLHGHGRNGKDTLLETVAHVLGDVAGPVSEDVLIAGELRARAGSASPHIVDLQGKRLVWVSETNEGARLNAGQVKLITGGGRLKGRPLYGRLIEFVPTHLILLITNNKPHASSDDYALWKRLLLVEFKIRFIDEPKERFERSRDPDLLEKLKAEAPGILAWLVKGCFLWRTLGLNPPESVRLATDKYREEEDALAQFIADRCVVGDGVEAKAGDLFKVYLDWAEEVGIRKPLGLVSFGKKMGNRFAKEQRPEANYYVGIGILIRNPGGSGGSGGFVHSFPYARAIHRQNYATTLQTLQTLQADGIDAAEAEARDDPAPAEGEV
jgi:putative DNA primase/helicase